MNNYIRSILGASALFCLTTQLHGMELDESCSVNVLNRAVQVSSDGSWAMPNVPSFMGRIRARATCVLDGSTISGQSDFFSVETNGTVQVPDIKFEEDVLLPSAPVGITFSNPAVIQIVDPQSPKQLRPIISMSDGSLESSVGEVDGLNFGSSNDGIVSVDSGGVLTGHASGTAIVSVRYDGALALQSVSVSIGGDADGDGIPDDFEQANGLDPDDSIDAFEDKDIDGLSNLEEYQLGTGVNVADTDNDGITDGEEVVEGADGFITSPLLEDTDGDGLLDGFEISAGSDPTDENSGDVADALDFITVTPADLVLTYNSIDGEASSRLVVTGTLLDGTEIDLTERSEGTTYTSSDLSIASFGLTSGEVFAGQPGSTTVVVSNRDKQFTVNVSVTNFDPVAVAALPIPGYANNVDIQGDYAYVAAGSAGLQVVNVDDRSNPSMVGAYDTPGIAIDVKVRGNTVFLADGDSGLSVIDVTDPLSPILLGQLTTSGTAQDLALISQFLYVASGNGGIDIFNVRDRDNVFLVGQNTELTGVKALVAENNYLAAVNANTLALFDASNPVEPLQTASVNIGNLKNLAIDNGYISVAAYSTGWKSFQVTDDLGLVELGGDARIVPRDVAITNGFSFYAEQLFPNVVAFINTADPDNPFFQGTINLSPFGDYAGTGIAVDNTHAYITEERFVVGSDYKSDGDSRLFIAQYRELNDNNGQAPSIVVTEPVTDDVLVQGQQLRITADADDDVAIFKVEFLVNGTKIAEDTTYPYTTFTSVSSDASSFGLMARAIDFGGNTTETDLLSLVVQPDRDADGLGDTDETDRWATDPDDSDSDDDGLIDGLEIDRGTDPNSSDTDEDGISDGDEVSNDTDPLNPDITAPTVLSSIPADSDEGIAENAPIQIVFSEPLARRSVNQGSIELLESGVVQVPGTLQQIGDGSEFLFTPQGLLDDFTDYTVKVTGVKDAAGNQLESEFTVVYTTGNTVDTERPRVELSNPPSSSNNIPVNVRVTVILSERIDPASITGDTVRVIDTTENVDITGAVGLLNDGQTITFTPNAALLVGRQHRIYLSGFTDLFGNTLSNTNIDFTTSFQADSIAPVVVSTTVADGQQNLPVNSRFLVRFNEAINPQSIPLVTLRSGGVEVLSENTVSSDRTLVTVNPRVPLDPGAQYSLVIGAVEDSSGNILAQSQTINFSTGTEVDSTGISILSISPPNNSRNLSVSTQIVAQVSEPIDPATLTSSEVYLYDSTEGRRVESDLELLDGGRRIVITPTSPLESGHNYYSAIGYGNYLYDYAGNRLSRNIYYFTTGGGSDAEAPTVLYSNIQVDSDNVAQNTQVLLWFNEPLNNVCVSTATATLSGGGVDASVDVSNDGEKVWFTQTDMLANTDYTLTVDGLCDLSGNEFGTYSVSFTTSAVTDTTAPSIVSLDPASNAQEVAVTSTITLEFNELINDLNYEWNGSGVRVYTASGDIAGSWVVSGTTAVFTPLNPLPAGQEVDVRGYVVDLSRNRRLIAYDFDTATDGTDVEIPQVVSITPNDGAIDIGPNSDVVLIFSESLNSSDVNNTNFVLYANGSVIKPSVYRSGDGRTVTLRGTWPSAQAVSVVVTDDVRDLSGNTIEDYVSVFTTASVDTDTARPTVSRQYPPNSASGVSADSPIVLFTSESMNESTLDDAFRVSQNGVLIDGQLSVSGQGRALRFEPNQSFTAGARIEVFLQSTARDTSGNAVQSYQGSFRVTQGDAVGVNPAITAYNPYSNQSDVPLNPVIQASFSQTLDSANLGEVTLYDYGIGGDIPVTISLEDNSRTLQVIPDALLTADTDYRVRIRSMTDTDGDAGPSNSYLYFSTAADAVEDDQPPQLLSFSPPDGKTDVALNPRFYAQFDESINTISVASMADTTVSFAANNREVFYTRYEPLPENSEITELVPAAQDAAGNTVAESSTTFQTGSEPDIALPLVESWFPESGSTVPVNSTVRVRFNEPLVPGSVTEGRFYLHDTVERVNVAATVSLDAEGRTLTLVPDDVLAVGRSHYIYATSVTDLSGNALRSNLVYFNTSLEGDQTPPVVGSTTVTEGQTGIPTNARIRVRFNETVDKDLLSGITLTVAGEPVSVSTSVQNGTLVTLTPKQLLPESSAMLLTIAGVKDLAGNELAQVEQVGFTTGTGIDTRTSTIVAISPNSNAQDVPLNVKVDVLVSEPLDITTLTSNEVYLYDSTEGRRVESDLELLDGGRRIVITPTSPLESGHNYYSAIGYGNYLYDYAGNRLSRNIYYFTTGVLSDTVIPTLNYTNISEGVDSVPINASIDLWYNEPLNAVCAQAASAQLEVNGGLYPVIVSTFSSALSVVRFSPEVELEASSNYVLRVNGLCDLSQNPVGEVALNFSTTASTDTTTPSVVSVLPASSEQGVSVTSNIVVQFSEPLDAGQFEYERATGRNRVYTSSGNIEGFWVVNGSEVGFTPLNPLPSSSTVSIRVYYRDSARNGSTTASSFTTE